MPGDLYQSPGFGWLHAGQRAGLAALTLPETLATGSSKARLIDGMGQRRCVWNASGAKSVRFDRGAAVREPIGRLYIPSGHNLAGHRLAILTDPDGTWVSSNNVFPYRDLRGLSLGTGIVTDFMTIRPGVNVFDFPLERGRWPGLYIWDRVTNVPELGEVYFTRMWQPSVGLDANRQHAHEPNVSITKLPSGVAFATERGGLARTWEFDTEVLTGADRLLYETKLAECGVSRDPFLFDPTSGGYETIVDDCEASAASWTATAGVTSLSDASGVFYAGSKSLSVVCSGAANAVLNRVYATPMDLRGCVLGISFRTTTFAAWATPTDGFRVYLRNAATSGWLAYWAFGENHITSNGAFFKLWIDLDNDAPASVGASSVDLSAVTTIQIETTNNGNTPTFYLDDIRYVRKRLAPAMVRVASVVPVRQRAPGPYGSGEYFSLRYQLEEMLA